MVCILPSESASWPPTTGDARLVEILTRNRQRDLNEIVLLVFEELHRWTGGGSPHDDATIVLARAR